MKRVIVCPECRTINKTENKFCQKCGKSLEGIEPQEIECNKKFPLWLEYIIYIFVLAIFVYGFVFLYYAIMNDNLNGNWESVSSSVAWTLGPIVALIFVLSIWSVFKFVRIERKLNNIQVLLNEMKNGEK